MAKVIVVSNLVEVSRILQERLSGKENIHFGEFPTVERKELEEKVSGKLLKMHIDEKSVSIGNRIVGQVDPKYITIKDCGMPLFEIGIDVKDQLVIGNNSIFIIKSFRIQLSYAHNQKNNKQKHFELSKCFLYFFP